jgi:hypothetical protein
MLHPCDLLVYNDGGGPDSVIRVKLPQHPRLVSLPLAGLFTYLHCSRIGFTDPSCSHYFSPKGIEERRKGNTFDNMAPMERMHVVPNNMVSIKVGVVDGGRIPLGLLVRGGGDGSGKVDRGRHCDWWKVVVRSCG